MKTSSWFLYSGIGRVGISRGLPHRVSGGFRRYAPLQPGIWFKTTDDYDEYRSIYFKQLGRLDPNRVVADLHNLAHPAAEPILLCFCDLRRGGWCHRRMVAEWIFEETGIAVEEVAAECAVAVNADQSSLF